MPDPLTADQLATMTDREIGPTVREGVAKLPAIKQARATGAQPTLATPESAGMEYSRLTERHPEYQAEYWASCRAFYAGGSRLLQDPELMKRVFPSHQYEAGDIYKQRCLRAFYISYPGEIIDHLLAGFSQDPLRLSAGKDEKTNDELDLPEEWAQFADDVSPPGGMRQPLGSFAVDCLREMFITQSAWVMVDLPYKNPEDPQPANKLEEEQAGLTSPYLCLMPSECVIDWQADDETGELEWALCYWKLKRRGGIDQSRGAITERWIYWTPTEWQRYELTYEPGTPPQPHTVVPMTGSGPNAFNAVPMVRIQVPEGMYAMGKLESIAREHFNKRCALSWAEYKSLFAMLYEFLAPEQGSQFNPVIAQAQQDANRAVNQVRGQGHTQIRGAQDKAEFIGPDSAPFAEARESCSELMREMHRVMFSMALSANMDSAALKRSGDSKEQDTHPTSAILSKCGEILREGIDAVLDMVALVFKKGERPVSTVGGEKFDADSISGVVQEGVDVTNGIPMKSPTFNRLYLFGLYKQILGPRATDKDLESIRNELETAVTAESLLMADSSPPGPQGPNAPKEPDSDKSEPDDGEEPTQPSKKPKPGPRRIFASK